jgi:hypothetical protein
MSDRATVRETQDLTGTSAIAASVAGTSYRCSRYTEVLGFVLVGTMTGTAPQLVVKYQVSPDETNWADLPGGQFDAITASDTNEAKGAACIGEYIRVYHGVSGTTPSIPVTTVLVFKT